MDSKLQKLEEVLKLLDKDTPTTEDVSQVIGLVLEAVSLLKSDLENKIGALENKQSLSDEEVWQKINEIISVMGDMNSSHEEREKEHKNHREKMKSEVLYEVKRLIGEIKMPETADLAPLERRLDKVESKEEIELPKDLVNEERLMEEINRLEEELRKKQKSGNLNLMGGIIGRDLVKDVDISAQLDGVTKTFNIAGVYNIISVDLSSFPYGSLRKNVDYTWTSTSITFTSQIDAPTQLASGQSCVLTVVSA